MFSEKQKTEVSKFLSYVLRHAPESIGLNLSKSGWVSVETLIEKSNANAKKLAVPLTREILNVVVAEDKKTRYSFSENGLEIRANQGHSVEVELGLKNVVPPVILFHGTVEESIASIVKGGLKPMSRHAVHLSKDVETAKVVGSRRGKAIILEINSKAMFADGYKFQCSENGVWLTAEVPSRYIKFPV